MKKMISDKMIAPWRIDSDEEKRLANEADVSENGREQYVQYYHDNDPVYYNKGLEMIDKVIENFRPGASSKAKKAYVIDMVYSLHRFGCMFDEYFLFDYEHKNTAGRESFITDKNRWEYYQKLNTEEGRFVFNNKLETYRVFKDFYKRELICASDKNDYEAFCVFRRKHASFIVKPILGSGGRGIYIENESNKSNEEVFERITENGTVVIEELVKQDVLMESLHGYSLNTVRIPTISINQGEVVLFQPFLRIGVGISEVDNAAKGGIICPVDPDTGIVMQRGVTEAGRTYIKHPDSGIVLPGFQIPKWDEAISFVKKLATMIPECHYVGWDCALSVDGWIMIEGNPQGQFVTQYATKEGCRPELDRLIGGNL
ncbi:MAG: hypothetical protein IKP72_01580 [Clostridia bacterium]|nr:hypothetical protein [Clostridia bacterium]